MIKSEIKVAAILFGALFCAFAGAGEVDSVLAAVNGEPVTLGEILPAVRDREFQLRNAFSGKKLENEVLKVRCKAIEEIINRKLIVSDFHSKNLILPPQEVENEIDRWGRHIGCPSRRELEERVRKSGIPFEKIRKQITERMIVQIMRRREFTMVNSITPADLYERFKKEEKNLSSPGKVELALLKTAVDDRESAEKIGKVLAEDPNSWQEFATKFAITPGTDGNIGSVDLDKLRAEFAKNMKDIAPGRIYSGIKTADGIYFIKVIKYVAPEKAEFGKHVEKIRNVMENELYRKSSEEYAARLRDKAVIEYFFPVPEGVVKK